MNDIDIMLEEAFAEMDEAFLDWSEACDALARTPDLPERLSRANIAHERFLLARERTKQIMTAYREMLMEENG